MDALGPTVNRYTPHKINYGPKAQRKINEGYAFRPMRMFTRHFPNFLGLALLVVSLLATSCTDKQTIALDSLRQLGIEFDVTSFHKAVAADDVKLVTTFLDAGASVDWSTDGHLSIPNWQEARQSHNRWARSQLKHLEIPLTHENRRKYLINRFFATALVVAWENNADAVARVLLQRGADTELASQNVAYAANSRAWKRNQINAQLASKAERLKILAERAHQEKLKLEADQRRYLEEERIVLIGKIGHELSSLQKLATTPRIERRPAFSHVGNRYEEIEVPPPKEIVEEVTYYVQTVENELASLSMEDLARTLREVRSQIHRLAERLNHQPAE